MLRRRGLKSIEVVTGAWRVVKGSLLVTIDSDSRQWQAEAEDNEQGRLLK